jgi:hypothetical protein
MQRFQQPPPAPFYPIVGAMYPPPGLPFPQQFIVLGGLTGVF